MTTHIAQITIRPAYADDYDALARLAALDSAQGVPHRPLLIAEVDGILRAALSLRDGIADLRSLLSIGAAADAATRPRRRRPPYAVSGLSARDCGRPTLAADLAAQLVIDRHSRRRADVDDVSVGKLQLIRLSAGQLRSRV